MTTAQKKKALDKQAIELWKMACLKKWGDKCIICGRNDQTTFHHYIPKSKSLRLKYDVLNGVPICNMREHYVLHHGKDPDEVTRICNIIREKRGKDWCDYVEEQKRKKNVSLYKVSWLEEQIEELKKVLKLT